MDVRLPACTADICHGLRICLLGRAACALWPHRGYARDDPRLHVAFENYLTANATAHAATRPLAPDRALWSSRAHEPLAKPRGRANRPSGSDGAHHRRNQLVGSIRALA